MAKNKQCAYCGTKDRKETYRRLPNGLYACVLCHRNKNPLWMASAVDAMKKVDKDKLFFKTKAEEEEFDEAVKKAKDAPPLYQIEANPIIRGAYKKLMPRRMRRPRKG